MEISSENAVDSALKEMVQAIERLHSSAVASVQRDIATLKTELKELKEEKNLLISQYDVHKDDQLALDGELSTKLNQKSLLYQLLHTMTRALSKPPESTTRTDCNLDNSWMSDVNVNINEYTTSGFLDDSRDNSSTPVNLTHSRRISQSHSLLDFELSAMEEQNDASQREVHLTGHSKNVTNASFSDRRSNTLQQSKGNLDVSPMSHLLNLISSTHQLTVKPLRTELYSLKQKADQLRSEISSVKLKIQWLQSGKQNTMKRLELENTYHKQMKDLFQTLSQRVSTSAFPKVHLEEDVGLHGPCTVFEKPVSLDTQTCAEFPSMVKPWLSTEKNDTNTMDLTGDTDNVVIELQQKDPYFDGYSSFKTISSRKEETQYTTQEGCDTTTKISITEKISSSVAQPDTKGMQPLKRLSDATTTQVRQQTNNHCGICGQHFPDVVMLSKHKCCQRSVENICRHCKRPFSSSTALKIHMRCHTGERPYLCQECGKTFAQAISLRIHLRKHTGERPHKCFECGREFHDPCYFKKHQRKHLENKLKK